ncbi:MAG TPA: hypothetical protein VN132_15450 [Bdellovibrio sp.]|nr:hypothetical protein [Bdellovibrio sp.]
MIKIFLFFPLLFSSMLSFAGGLTIVPTVEFKSSDEILSEFKNYADVDPDQSAEHISDIIVRVHWASEFCLKNSCEQEIFDQIVRVSFATLKNDFTYAVGEYLVPLYREQKSKFEKALRRLPASSSEKLLKNVQDAIDEMENGNG